VVDPAGNTRAFAVAPIETRFPIPTWAEQDPDSWWAAARSAVPNALSNAGIKPDRIAAIGLDTTACTVVACDNKGVSLRPALLWMDQRSAREAEIINATRDPVLKYVSGRVSPEWMLPKALWLKNNEPRVYNQSARIVECTDWFMYKLTNQWMLAQNHVAVKWNYVRPEGGWPARLMHEVGLDDLLLKWPNRIIPLGMGDAVLDPSAAAELGLKAGTPVAQGGIDAYLGMIGLGATGDGDLAVIIGSSTCHLGQSKTAILGSGAGGCYPDATVEGLYTIEAGQTATGSILDWYRRHFASAEAAEAEKGGVSVWDILDAKAAAVPAGAEGLVARDDFQGNRSPHKNPDARGAFTGLSLAHGPGHLLRALYESTACGTRQIIDDLAAHGMNVRRVIVGGGGVKSALWMQIHADVLDRPVHIPRESEACALGSAMAAAVRAGIYPDFDSAAAHMVAIDRVLDPSPANRSTYDDVYNRYVDLYDALNRDPGAANST
jgi:FGGY-family pentulose kinase